jgi:uncharacterized membrane protein
MFYYFTILLTVISNVLYHVFQKMTSSNVNPVFSLIITYGTAMIAAGIMYLFYPGKVSFWDNFKDLNWASYALGIVIIGLELGFLLAYRVGWQMNLAAMISNSAVAILLIPLGFLLFRETLTYVNALGIALCVIGLILVNHKM